MGWAVTLQRRLLEVTQDAYIGHTLKPPRGHLVEMLQGVKGAAVEQADFGEVELTLDFSLRLRPPNATRLGPETVVRGQGEKLGIVENALGVVTQHDRLEVVVQTDACDAAEVMKGVYVFTQGRWQIHRLDETQILPTRVAEHVAEEIDTPAAFAREVDVVDAKVHLGLHAWSGLKARHGRARGARAQPSDALAHHRVLAGEATRTQLLQDTLGREMRVLFEQFLQDRLERIDDALARARPGGRRGPATGRTIPSFQLMCVLSTTPQSKKGNGGRKIAFTTARSSLRFGVEELYPGLTQKKMCKDMLKRCPAAALASSHAHNAYADDAPDIVLRGPTRDVTPSGTPHCKIACSNVHGEW